MKPNIPLLRKTVEWVEEQEELLRRVDDGETDVLSLVHWDQETWYEETSICGAVYCFAGKIALDEGWVPTLKQRPDTSFSLLMIKDDEVRQVSQIAADALGISFYQAEPLFNGGNSAARIREVAEGIAGEKL